MRSALLVLAAVSAAVVTVALVVAADMSFASAAVTAVIIGCLCGWRVGLLRTPPSPVEREEESSEVYGKWRNLFLG